jgi:TonB family protein
MTASTSPFYLPRDEHHGHGICEMHVAVTASGAVSSIEITQSTGSQALDQACKDAIYQSPFVPATQGDQPVNGTTEVAILWRLPRPSIGSPNVRPRKQACTRPTPIIWSADVTFNHQVHAANVPPDIFRKMNRSTLARLVLLFSSSRKS